MDKNNIHLNDVFQLPKDEALTAFYERMITIPITSIMALKKELTTTVGKERTKGIFIRYGWHHGVSDGEKAMTFQWSNELELINAGPKLHKLHGYLDDIKVTDIKFDKEGSFESMDAFWINSFEADQLIYKGSYSDQPVCHTMCGYASGYLSTVLKRQILVRETKCSAMGHDRCEVICMPMEKYGEELEKEYRYYQSTSMIQELDEITAKLKNERDNLSKTYDIHRQLISELLSKNGLQRIVNVLYQTTGLPTFIEDGDNDIRVKSNEVMLDIELSDLNSATSASFIRISDDTGILRTPIYFEEQIKGYCSFIFQDHATPDDLDYMIIDQASLTASIILLNENIKVNTELNIRRSFLNDILEGRLDKEELYKHARYLQFDPNDCYWMLTVERGINNSNLTNEIEVNEKLMRHLHAFFRERNINVIVTQESGRIIILVEYSAFEKLLMNQSTFIQQLLKHALHRFTNYTFYIGVSSLVQHIDQIKVLYEETLAALQAKNPQKKILYYEDLGIESLLFQIPDETLINRFVDKQVGELMKEDKHLDLIRTFYAYVENGININHTAKAISMSISGLRYRLSRISEVLEIDFDDTKSVFSVYMALNVLKARGKIKF